MKIYKIIYGVLNHVQKIKKKTGKKDRLLSKS